MTGGIGEASMDIRRARPFDAALMAGLHAACFDTVANANQRKAWDEAAMAQLIADPSTLCLLATASAEEPTPAGFLIARAASDEAELFTIGVLTQWRQRGVGRALLRQAVFDLRASGVRQLFLEVDEANQPALTLYRGLGAETVGRRPGYYENGGSAALLRLDLQSCSSGPATR